jgi:peptidoglycan/LPS O-acetylase OafA/YrhL
MQKKLTWIDSLRAIAILMVIAVHTGGRVIVINGNQVEITSYGQMGVQLFFIVSAITLCMSAASRINEPHPLANFYSRRFFRIAPGYWVGIFFYLVWNTVRNYHTAKQAMTAAVYTPVHVLVNVFFLNGFYPPANTNVVPGGWSIGTEMAFYAIFPLLWMLQSRLSLKRLWLLPATSILLSSGILYLVYALRRQTVTDNSFLYFNIVTQLNVFITGILAYRCLHLVSKRMSLFLFLCFACMGIFAWNLHFVSVFYLIPVLFAIAFAGLALYFSQLPETIWMRFLAPIGKVSFSMYLFHFAVVQIVIELLNSFSFHAIAGRSMYHAALYIFGVAASFGVAKISYRFIEKPGIAFGKRVTLKWLNPAPKTKDRGEDEQKGRPTYF